MLKQKNVKIVHNKSLIITQLKKFVNNAQSHHHFSATQPKSVKNVHKKSLSLTQLHSRVPHVHQQPLFTTQSQTLVTDVP